MVDNEARVHFRMIRFIHEAGLRLKMKSIPLATACVIYHRFFKEYTLQECDAYYMQLLKNYTGKRGLYFVTLHVLTCTRSGIHLQDWYLQECDAYLIASTAIYLAGKVEEDHLKPRDVVNVCYGTLHKRRPPLEYDQLFKQLNESIVDSELFVLRALQFRLVFHHPHRYLLHYLKFLKDWMEPLKWDELPLARTAWALLRDSYHGRLCLQYKPQHIAVAILYMTLESHGADIPYEHSAITPWWKVFADDITLDIIKMIVQDIINIYDLETSLSQ